MQNTWATDQYALIFILTYDGDNRPIRRLQIRLMLLFVDIVHRNANFLGGADYGSREAGDLWYDRLITQHNAFTHTLRKNFAAPMGPLKPKNVPGYRAWKGNQK